MNKGKVTRNAVAQMAGVSTATVSRVYNDPASVSPVKRELVLEAAGDLGYRPNKQASSLRRGTTGTVMLLECGKPRRSYYWKQLRLFNWFYADIIHGLQEVFERSMYTLQLKRVEKPGDIDRREIQTDGIIGFDIDLQEEADAAAGLGIPYILCHHTASFQGNFRCATDNVRGGALQAEYLFEQGCGRVCCLTGYLAEVYPHRERLEGFLGRSKELGLQAEVIDYAMEDPKGAAAVLRRGMQFDGIAAVNDLTLMNILQEVSLDGVPMIGYDAVPIRHLLSRTFPSVDPRPREIYHRSAQLLITRLSGGEIPELQVIPPVISLG